jgi:lipopolysaccharide export system permease protein
MTLLNRYILFSFGRIFALALGSFTGLYLLVDFFEKVDNLLDHHARAIHYLTYFGTKIPLILTQITPLALLLAVFMTLGGFSRTSELTAMRAGGISLWRISLPLLAAGLAAALCTMALTEYVVPLAARKMNHTMDVEVRGKPEQLLKREKVWFRERQTIVHIDLAVPEENTLQGVQLFRFDDRFRIIHRIDAARALYKDGKWTAGEVVIRRFNPENGELSEMKRVPEGPLSLEKTPQDFRTARQNNEELTFRDLRRMIRRLQEEGYDPSRDQVDLHARLATPLASLVMAFLGIPFALKKGRGSSLAVGIAVAVAIGLAYHLLQSLFMAFGYSSVLPPAVAAWAAHILFILLGIWMMLTVRE